MTKFIKINQNDNVAVCLEAGQKGATVSIDNFEIVLLEDISVGHKMALQSIEEHANVIKYGAPIGHALRTILPGETVHVHNMKTNLSGTIEYSFQQKLNELTIKNKNLTFDGYVRSNGKTGIRNELWIVPTVGCVNGQAQQIIDIFKQENNPLESIDAVEVFKHNYGCSQLGDDHVNTQKALAALINHPNAGGVLVLGLGCENNQISQLKTVIGEYDSSRIKFLIAQDVEDEIEEGVKLLGEIFQEMKNDKRQPVPVSELNIGLKCGGSDGFSGITANPLVGEFSDFLVAQGGTTILTEVPEMFGAETLLMERAIDKSVFDKTVSLINDFKDYYMQHNLPVYENPSPGNKNGGISTLEDKSLGCIQKGGTANVTSVLDYGEKSRYAGLNLLYGPGNDLIACTALIASGAQLILFTTGRGTPLGAPVPTVKISCTTGLYCRKDNWMDFDAGRILQGGNIQELGTELLDYIVHVADGDIRTRNEVNDFREIGIFKDGVCL